MRYEQPFPKHQNEAIFGLFIALAATTCAAGTIPAVSGVPLSVEQITGRLSQTEDQKRTDLREYSVTRKYILRNSHMKQDAEMLVRVTYSKERGKSFQVIEAKAVEGMSKRVFQHLIDGEKEGSRKENMDRSTVNERNYSFELLGTEMQAGRRCHVLALKPKSKSKYLLNGKAWIDAEDFAVVRLEGQPAANLSFWVGKPHIVQTWQKFGEFWMAAENRSLAQSKLLGSSELTVRNSDYELCVDRATPVALGPRRIPKQNPNIN